MSLLQQLTQQTCNFTCISESDGVQHWTGSGSDVYVTVLEHYCDIRCEQLDDLAMIQLVQDVAAVTSGLTLRIPTNKSSIVRVLEMYHGFVSHHVEDCIELTQQLDGIHLTEEHNTSLMYHKLFPNRRLLRDLEGKGYTFEMGDGLKLQKRFFASSHRNSSNGPRRQRTIQSLVILKNGEFFRKIPKQKWVQLVDSSDNSSKTWGEVFMTQLLRHEQDSFEKQMAQFD